MGPSVPPEVVSLLVALLPPSPPRYLPHEEVPIVQLQQEAIRALARIGPLTPEIVPALVRCLAYSDLEAEAQSALVRIGLPAVPSLLIPERSVLVRLLEESCLNPNEGPPHYGARSMPSNIATLVMMSGKLSDALSSSNVSVQHVACIAVRECLRQEYSDNLFRHIRDFDSLQVNLVKCLDANDELVRTLCAHALWRLSVDNFLGIRSPDAPRAMHALTRLLLDPSSKVRESAARAIWEIGVDKSNAAAYPSLERYAIIAAGRLKAGTQRIETVGVGGYSGGNLDVFEGVQELSRNYSMTSKYSPLLIRVYEVLNPREDSFTQNRILETMGLFGEEAAGQTVPFLVEVLRKEKKTDLIRPGVSAADDIDRVTAAAVQFDCRRILAARALARIGVAATEALPTLEALAVLYNDNLFMRGEMQKAIEAIGGRRR